MTIKIARRPTTLFFAVFLLAALPAACGSNAPHDPTATSAATVPAPAGSARPPDFHPSDIGVRHGGSSQTPPRQIAQPAIVPASQHPGHFRNKIVEKPVQRAVGAPLTPKPAAYVAKQSEYVARWKELQTTMAGLSADEREARRAALKQSILGD